MRPLAALAFCLVLVAARGLEARQNDFRLEELFERLQSTTNSVEARELQARIWHVWIASGSDTVDLLMNRGSQAMAAGQYDAALEVFTSIVELDPDFAEGWNKRATLYYLMGEYTASVADIQRTLELEPRHFGALSGLGMIYRALDDDTGALKAFRKVLEVNPHAPGAREAVIHLKKKLKGEGI
jgi:tetratricopeptide (TPR) repeat protein